MWPEGKVRQGQRSGYHWLSLEGEIPLGSLIGLFPEIVLNRYVVVTSYDSGVMLPTPAQIASGWRVEGEFTYSPPIRMIRELEPLREDFDSEYYNECYVFCECKSLGRRYRGDFFQFDETSGEVQVFVNLLAFNLADCDEGILEGFWRQMERIAPQTYIAEGEGVVSIASKDQALIAKIVGSL